MNVPLFFVKNALDANCSTIREADRMAKSEQDDTTPPIFTATTTISGPSFQCMESYKFEINKNGELTNLVKTLTQNEFRGESVVSMNEFNNIQPSNSAVHAVNVEESAPKIITNNMHTNIGIDGFSSCASQLANIARTSEETSQKNEMAQNNHETFISSSKIDETINEVISNFQSSHLQNLAELSNFPRKDGKKYNQAEQSTSSASTNSNPEIVMKMKVDSPPNIQFFNDNLSSPVMNQNVKIDSASTPYVQFTPSSTNNSPQEKPLIGILNGDSSLNTNFILPNLNGLIAMNLQQFSYQPNPSGNDASFSCVDLIDNKLSIPKFQHGVWSKTAEEPVEHKISLVPFEKVVNVPASVVTISDNDEEEKRSNVPKLVLGSGNFLIPPEDDICVYVDSKFVKESEYSLLHKLMEDINQQDQNIETLKCRLLMKFRQEFTVQFIPNEILQTCFDIILRRALSLVDGSLRHTTMTISFHQPCLPNLKKSFEDVTYEFFNGPHLVHEIDKIRNTVATFCIDDMFRIQVDIGEQKERSIVKGHKTLLKAVGIGMAYLDHLDGQKESKETFIELMTSKVAQNKVALQLQRKLGITEHEANGNTKLIRKVTALLSDIKLTVLSTKTPPKNYNKHNEKTITVSEVNGKFDILLPA